MGRKVTRLEVIGTKGREYSHITEGHFEVSIQDEGRTLKIFDKVGPAWYEDASNIGKLIYVDNVHWQGMCIFKHLHDRTITVIYLDGGECIYSVEDCRPITSEELTDLSTKE